MAKKKRKKMGASLAPLPEPRYKVETLAARLFEQEQTPKLPAVIKTIGKKRKAVRIKTSSFKAVDERNLWKAASKSQSQVIKSSSKDIPSAAWVDAKKSQQAIIQSAGYNKGLTFGVTPHQSVIEAGEKEIKPVAIKPVIGKPIAPRVITPVEPPKPLYFNKDAYILAIRTMGRTEAYRLAKDEALSVALLNQHKPKVNKPVAMPADAITLQIDKILPLVAQDVKAVAEFRTGTIKQRINQGSFSKRVADNFGGVCAITGSGEACQAAHIEPVSTGNNCTSNGLYMLSSLHYLFDHRLMAIHPEHLTVHFSEACTWFAKSQFEGKPLSKHSVKLNTDGLEKIWIRFIRKVLED